MFQRLQENPTINGIMCVPYSNIMRNDNARQRCIDVLGNIIPNEAVIVYSPSDDGIVVLGYYILNNQNITESVFYNALRDNSINSHGIDCHQSFLNAECHKIQEWVFDVSLNNKQHLYHIFSIMISSIETHERLTILWCESGFNDIIYYPIDNENNNHFYPLAEYYFSGTFYSIIIEQPNQ